MRKLVLAAALMAGGTFAPALASEALSDLQIYGILSKLEANKAEAAGALLKHAFAAEGSPERAEAAEDFTTDAAAIEAYLELLEGQALPEDTAEELDEFKAAWAKAMAGAAELQKVSVEANGIAQARARSYEWWESLDEADDAIDEALDGFLEAKAAALPAVGQDTD